MSAFDEKSVPRRREEATSRNVDGEEVVVLPHVGYVHVLNETGAFLWAHMDGKRTVEQIAPSSAQSPFGAVRRYASVTSTVMRFQPSRRSSRTPSQPRGPM